MCAPPLSARGPGVCVCLLWPVVINKPQSAQSPNLTPPRRLQIDAVHATTAAKVVDNSTEGRDAAEKTRRELVEALSLG